MVAINKFLKDNNIEIGKGESLDDISVPPGEEIDTNTAAIDAETPEAAAKQPTQAAGTTPETRSDTGFKFTPTTGLIIGAVVIGGYLLMKKKSNIFVKLWQSKKEIPKKPKAKSSVSVLENYLKKRKEVDKYNAALEAEKKKKKTLIEKIRKF